MAEHIYLEEEEMVRRAVDALLRDLGSIETTRFLSFVPRHRLDSVTRHRLWQESLDRDRFFDRVYGKKLLYNYVGVLVDVGLGDREGQAAYLR